ncbi:phosphoglycerate mutase-like protein [Ascobolus immersus RN42]|uniref:Phosphoglycerate mutase-like protein n=1 Tax=Ascobolus immersus RN42 TaxID=1160509 RepID=A0A3N4IFJ1_ASCIM|nr:phosphoglycerate mutase-like protein [Ascobolus immersus RN42]
MSPISLTAAVLLASILPSAIAHGGHGHVVSTVIFHRHGDRTPKLLGNTHLTPLGQSQLFDSGLFYRTRYITGNNHGVDISDLEEKTILTGRNEVNVYSPDEVTLGMSASSWASGFYDGAAPYSQLSDNTNVTSPVGDEVYAVLHSTPADYKDAIWLKGDDGCTASEKAAVSAYFDSVDFLKTEKSSATFYSSLKKFFPEDALAKLNELEGGLSFRNAYIIYDYLYFRTQYPTSDNTPTPSESELSQAKQLADQAEVALNKYDPKNKLSAISARTLLGRVTSLLEASIKSDFQTNRVTYLSGSYDTILSLFSILGLDGEQYKHIPEYGASFVFELLQDDDDDDDDDFDLRISFRNGTAESTSLKNLIEDEFDDLKEDWEEEGKLITSASQWCTLCNSDREFCALYDDRVVVEKAGVATLEGGKCKKESMNNANAGVIGAMVTLVVLGASLAAAWGLGFVAFGRRRKQEQAIGMGAVTKTVSYESSVAERV